VERLLAFDANGPEVSLPESHHPSTAMTSQPAKFARLLAVSVFCLLSFPLIGQAQSDTSYVYQGELVELLPAPSSLAFILDRGAGAELQRIAQELPSELTRDFPFVDRVEVLPQVSLVVVEYLPGTSQALVARMRSDILRIPAVLCAAPAFSYKGTLCVAGDEILAEFEAELSEQEIRQIALGANADVVVADLKLPGWRLLRCRDARQWGGLVVANSLSAHDSVESAEPNFIQFLRPLTDPDDTYYSGQWALRNLGSNSPSGQGLAGADIQAPDAWDITTGRPDVVVAVLDEGVDTAHEDLQTKIVAPYDATDGDTDQEPNPWDGHGTACAGIVAAESNNGMGVSGVSWASSIMPVRIAYSSAPGNNWTTQNYWIGIGITTAVLQGADILSNSWGGGVPSNYITSAIQLGKSAGRDGKGCVFVFAAGNDDLPSISYPASLSEVVAVGASDEFDYRVSTGTTGTWGSNYGPELDVVAPGINIWTTDISGTGGGYNQGSSGDPQGNYYDRFNGTSAATPHVAGLAALLLAVNPGLTSDAVQTAIEQSAEDEVGHPTEDTPGRDDFMGWGRINAYNALVDVGAYVPVSGTLTADTTWESGVVYRVVGDVTVSAGVTLTIEPGAIVKFAYTSSSTVKKRLIVSGDLQLGGSPGNPVYFTSDRDDSIGGDTNGDGTATSPVPGDWGYIQLKNATTAFHDAVVRYGGRYGSGSSYRPYMLWIQGGDPDILGCTFEYAYSTAVYYVPTSALPSTPLISGNTFSFGGAGFVFSGPSNQQSQPQVTSNNFFGYTTAISLAYAGQALVSSNTIAGCATAIFISDTWIDVLSNTITDASTPLSLGSNASVVSAGGNSFLGTTLQAVSVSGEQAGQYWAPVDLGTGSLLPYRVIGDVTVSAPGTLTIAAGTIVKFAYTSSSTVKKRLIVSGDLQLGGSPGNPVYFTSDRDDSIGGDTNGDGTATSPVPGDWGYIQLKNATTAFHDAVVRYGGRYGSGSSYRPYMLWIQGGDPDILGCTFEYAYSTAVYYVPTSALPSTPLISGNTFSSNPLGLDFSGPSNLLSQPQISWNRHDGVGNGMQVANLGVASSIRNCSFLDVLSTGLSNASPVAVDSRWCYWGDPSGPSGFGPGQGAAVSDDVLYSPWLTSDPGTGANSATGVLVAPRLDGSGLVDVTYDLWTSTGLGASVYLLLSQDGGQSFPYVLKAVTGAVGYVQHPGAGFHVLWDPSLDLQNPKGRDFVVRVVVSASGFGDSNTFDLGGPGIR